MLMIGSRIGNKRDSKEYACKSKGQCDAEERVQTRESREGSVRPRAPETVGGKKRRGRRSPQKRKDEKKEGRGAGMQRIKTQLCKNKECSVHRPIIWQLGGGGRQLATSHGGKIKGDRWRWNLVLTQSLSFHRSWEWKSSHLLD